MRVFCLKVPIYVRYYLRCVYRPLRNFLVNAYALATLPWARARFYAAWVHYQKDSVYRERLLHFGFRYAFDSFLKCKVSRDYVLRLRLAKEPELKWRIRFLPWSIPRPDIFETAVRSGLFEKDETVQ